MNTLQKKAIEAMKRARDFVNEHPLEAPATYGVPKVMLDDVLARVSVHSVDQVTHRREGHAETRRKAALKRRLRMGHLRPISQVAKAGLPDKPGIAAAFRIPPANVSETGLVAEAKGVRTAVAPYEAEFVANGAPADFLAQLDAAISALDASVAERARNVRMRAGARKGLAQEIRRGKAAVQMLDAVIARRFIDQDAVLERWRAAKRIGVAGVRSRPDAAVPGDTTVAPDRVA